MPGNARPETPGTVRPETRGIAAWLAGEMGAREVRIRRYERLPGGAIQGNFALDVDVAGGAYTGAQALVLRTWFIDTYPKLARPGVRSIENVIRPIYTKALSSRT